LLIKVGVFYYESILDILS